MAPTLQSRTRPKGSQKPLSKIEQKVWDWIRAHPERALHASAASMAEAIKTSDVTVIRTIQKLGYTSLKMMRESLAGQLRHELSIAERMQNELAQQRGHSTLQESIAVIRESMASIEHLPQSQIDKAVKAMASTSRIYVFGIGPSGFLAGYFALQLNRLGFSAHPIVQTGRQLADELVQIKSGDMIIGLGYGNPYLEIQTLFEIGQSLEVVTLLVTDAGPFLADFNIDLRFSIPRGTQAGFGYHAGTLAFIETLLVALSASSHAKTRQGLDRLETVRHMLAKR